MLCAVLAVDVIIFTQGFPETSKLFQGSLQDRKVEKCCKQPNYLYQIRSPSILSDMRLEQQECVRSIQKENEFKIGCFDLPNVFKVVVAFWKGFKAKYLCFNSAVMLPKQTPALVQVFLSNSGIWTLPPQQLY